MTRTISVGDALGHILTYEDTAVADRAKKLLHEDPDLEPKDGQLTLQQLRQLREEAWRTCPDGEDVIPLTRTQNMGWILWNKRGLPREIVLGWINRRYGRMAYIGALMAIATDMSRFMEETEYLYIVKDPIGLRDEALAMVSDPRCIALVSELYFEV